MVRKTWIIVCCVTLAAGLCAVTYAEKCEKGSVSTAVQDAIKALMPNASIETCVMEEEATTICELKVKDGEKECDVKLAVDGTVMEIESFEAIDAVPAAVAKTFKAQDAKLSKVEKAVEYAQLKVVKLETPITIYEAKITRNGKEVEVKVAADGTIIKEVAVEKEEAKCSKKDKDDDDKGTCKSKNKDKDDDDDKDEDKD
ncbi:MAG: hypothetical protein PHP01_05550 [Phycisphaerae bacterium]|nr:hypothetical protein [Phycisphaerae bacterium]